jgi:predicted permease
MATRLAIGAGRSRIVCQLMVENFVIAAAGGGLGLVIAQAAVDFFSRIEVVGDIPIRVSFELDSRVFLFTLIVSILSSILFGLAPALQSTRLDLASTLKTGEVDRPAHRLMGRRALVVVQIAISLVLLIGAARIYRGATAMLAANHAFRTQRTLTVRLDTEIAGYSQARAEQFFKTVVERTRATPGVKSAALSSFVPLTSNARAYTIVPEGYDFPAGQETVTVFGSTVTEGYFETLGVPIIEGRGFQATDTSTSLPVAILNDAFAKKYLGPDPVGKRLRINVPDGLRLVEVIGIAATGQYLSLVESPTSFLYLPLSQKAERRMTLIVESYGDPAALAGPIRALISSIDPNVPILAVRTMDEIFDKAAVLSTQLVTVMFASASTMGLFLAIVGLYALVAYQVSRRTREIGIRMALGAERSQVMTMVLKQASTLAITGIVIGLALSILSGRALTMGQSNPLDPVTLTSTPLALLLITLAAAWLPARRAARVSPLQALREE